MALLLAPLGRRSAALASLGRTLAPHWTHEYYIYTMVHYNCHVFPLTVCVIANENSQTQLMCGV